MPRLIPARERERGAVAVIVGLVVGFLVLTGVAALTIDAGSLYAERRVVQNAADAASLALAQVCGAGDAEKCKASWATEFADANSPDGFTDIASVCSHLALFDSLGGAIDIPICGALPATPTLVECTKLPSGPSATGNWVEVRTKTRSSATSSVVRRYFANDGTSVGACARAAWGAAGGVKAPAPVTFSECEWWAATGGSAEAEGTIYGNSPPFTADNPETPEREVALKLNAAKDAACSTWAGHDMPGGFGWLCHDETCTPPTALDCTPQVDGDGWVDANMGEGGGRDCKPEMTGMVGTVAYLPVFDCMSKIKNFCDNTAGGTKTFYHIKGYAAFYVTGVDIVGGMKKLLPGYPTPAAAATCTAKGGKCVYGWFLKDFVPAGTVIGDGTADFDLKTIQVIG